VVEGKRKPATISNRFIETVCARLADNKQIRRTLPVWGRVHIDRQLPFLCVYRRRKNESTAQHERLVTAEASYLTASANRGMHRQLAQLTGNVAKTMVDVLDSFLIIEMWVSEDGGDEEEASLYQPAFKIFTPKSKTALSTVATLEKSLSKIKIRRQPAVIDVVRVSKIAPPGLSALLSQAEARQFGCHVIGIEVRPVYLNRETGEVFPMIRRELQRGFAKALRSAFFQFTLDQTTHRPVNYLSLGRWSMVKAVWEVDRRLAEICSSFDFLLQVTPSNSHSAWSGFKRRGFGHAPEFLYRPLPMDPAMLKRRLYDIPIERIEDFTVAQVFREQQFELDRKLTMLLDRGSKRFMYGSLQLYGGVNASLLETASTLLEKSSARSRDETAGKSIDAEAFAARAREELDYFRSKCPDCDSKVFVREDISGLMVSQGNVLVGKNLRISESRLEALIQHEVGTHVLTYLNGKAQPFRQLYVGLAGYEELQEGLAVLSEFIVGGLTLPRLRLLAARVVAAHRLVQGASFVDVYRELNKQYGFEQRVAFTICMRIFRSGGLTKDAVYLRGLVQLLRYLGKGGKLEPLFVGKIAIDHIPIVQELQWRNVLHAAPLRPRYLDDPRTEQKLLMLANGIDLMDLIKRRKI